MKKHPARDKAEKLIKRLLFAGDIDTLPSVRNYPVKAVLHRLQYGK